MLLAFDIGNSNIVIGVFENNKLTHQWRLISDAKKTADDYAIDINYPEDLIFAKYKMKKK